MNEIRFSRVEGGAYESDAILMNGGDAVLHLEFSSSCNIYLLRSITADNYAEDTTFSTDKNGIAEVNVIGAVSGQYLKLRCFSLPLKAVILQ